MVTESRFAAEVDLAGQDCSIKLGRNPVVNFMLVCCLAHLRALTSGANPQVSLQPANAVMYVSDEVSKVGEAQCKTSNILRKGK